MVTAQFGTGQVLWSIAGLAVFVLVAGILLVLFADLLRADLSGWTKATWALGLLVLPLLGALLYLIVHGDDMSRRMVTRGRRRAVEPVGGSVEHELFRLSMLHEAGRIDDAEYAAARARVRG